MNQDSNQLYSVSVIIPAYNAEKYIARAIESVLAQSHPADEIIVVDDGSTDRTGNAVHEFGDKVRYIRQANAGAGAARNRGIDESRGEWVAFLDADDHWEPEKLKSQLSAVRQNPQLDWVGSNYYGYSDVTGCRLPECDTKQIEKYLGGEKYFEDYFSAYAAGIASWTGVMLIRRSVIKAVGMFDETLHNGEEDTDLWWRIAYVRPQFGYLAEPLATYHVEISESLMTRSKPREILGNMVRRHLYMAAQHGRAEAFRPVAAKWLGIHIRAMLFEARGDDIRCLASEFAQLFSMPYRVGMWVLTAFPLLTAAGCFAISKFVRLFNLRQRVVPRPSRHL